MGCIVTVALRFVGGAGRFDAFMCPHSAASDRRHCSYRRRVTRVNFRRPFQATLPVSAVTPAPHTTGVPHLQQSTAATRPAQPSIRDKLPVPGLHGYVLSAVDQPEAFRLAGSMQPPRGVAVEGPNIPSVCADITELNLPKRASIDFVDGKDKLLHFQITLRPDEGIYRFPPPPWLSSGSDAGAGAGAASRRMPSVQASCACHRMWNDCLGRESKSSSHVGRKWADSRRLLGAVGTGVAIGAAGEHSSLPATARAPGSISGMPHRREINKHTEPSFIRNQCERPRRCCRGRPVAGRWFEGGVWGECRGGAFTFDFRIDPGYSHVVPKVKCLTKVRSKQLVMSSPASRTGPIWHSRMSCATRCQAISGQVPSIGAAFAAAVQGAATEREPCRGHVPAAAGLG